MTRNLVVVSGGLNHPSSTSMLADRLAAATEAALRDHEVNVTRQVIDLRDHAHDLTDNLVTFFASESLQDTKNAVAAADGLIAVTPIFSGSYNGLFKTFFDLLEPGSIEGLPTLLGATAGTARHSLALEHALRPLFTYLKAATVSTSVFAASEDWGSAGDLNDGLSSRIERAGQELAAAMVAYEPTGPADPFTHAPTFEDLVNGS